MLLTAAEVATVQRALMRAKVIESPVFNPAQTTEALIAARAIVRFLPTAHAASRGRRRTPHPEHAYRTAAVLIAFAWTPFRRRAGTSAVPVMEALVRDQAAKDGWTLAWDVDVVATLVKATMMATSVGQPTDFVGITRALAAAMGPYRKPPPDKVNGRTRSPRRR